MLQPVSFQGNVAVSVFFFFFNHLFDKHFLFPLFLFLPFFFNKSGAKSRFQACIACKMFFCVGECLVCLCVVVLWCRVR